MLFISPSTRKEWCYHDQFFETGISNLVFTITAEIHTGSLANLYCQYADRHLNLKFMRPVSEREQAILTICYSKKQIDVSL